MSDQMSEEDHEQTEGFGNWHDQDAEDQYRDEQGLPLGTQWESFIQWNTDYVKNMAEGDGATFWQWGHLTLIIGEQNREAGESLIPVGGCEGTLVMRSRGSGLSRGKVEVSGSNDPQSFAYLFGQLSKKEIKFV